MASLVPFLKKEDLNAMPMGLAMTLSIWPPQTHNHIIKLLAGYILPILLGNFVLRCLPIVMIMAIRCFWLIITRIRISTA